MTRSSVPKTLVHELDRLADALEPLIVKDMESEPALRVDAE